jgi:hypothetical protein
MHRKKRKKNYKIDIKYIYINIEKKLKINLCIILFLPTIIFSREYAKGRLL